MLKTPVVFIIFNRPEETQLVFHAIKEARPSKLYIVADGPRIGREGEQEKCQETRSILNKIDWPCEVHTNFAGRNMGCKLRISSGLDWVFSKEDQAIILEDDCLPDQSFFPYCEELLERYRNDQRVMTICGGNYQGGRVRSQDSYYFSKYPRIWGWASWRRAWKNFDVNMKLWPEFRDRQWLVDIFAGNINAVRYWHAIFENCFHDKIDSWGFPCVFSHWAHRGLSITPNQNLISNIGYGVEATHTTNPHNPLLNIPLTSLSFPIRHPKIMVENYIQDDITQKKDFG